MATNLSLSIPTTQNDTTTAAAKGGEVINYQELASPSSYSSTPSCSPTRMSITDNAAAEESTTGAEPSGPHSIWGWLASFKGDMIGGAGMFTNGYNAMVLGYLGPVLKTLYPSISEAMLQNITNAYMIGEILGMIGIGVSIDVIGRRWGIKLTTGLMVVGILTVALAGLGGVGGTTALFVTISVGRAVSGFGAGGEFPVSTAGATESNNANASDRKHRGLKVALSTDTSIDLGFFFCGVILLTLLALYGFKPTTSYWRICIGIGAIIPVGLLYFRLGVLDETQYNRHAIKHNIPYRLAYRYTIKRQLGVGICWMCYGCMVVFSVYSTHIIAEMKKEMTLMETIGWSTLSQLSYVLGSPIGGLLMDRFGRNRVFAWGFFIWAVYSAILGATLLSLSFTGFLLMYCLFNFISEAGAGPCMFVTASESFPTPIRGRFLGMMAALGRSGSVAGTYGFMALKNRFETEVEGYRVVFFVASGVLLIGALSAKFLVPDTEGDLEAEDSRFDAYLVKHGYRLPEHHVGDEEQVLEGVEQAAAINGDSGAQAPAAVQEPAEVHAAVGGERT